VDTFADEIERLSGGKILDAVLFNTEKPTAELLERYANSGELSVEYDQKKLHNAHYIAAGAPLLAGTVWENSNVADPIAAQRTLIRHDSDAVAKALIELYHYAKKN
jgi:hypothetical protein